MVYHDLPLGWLTLCKPASMQITLRINTSEYPHVWRLLSVPRQTEANAFYVREVRRRVVARFVRTVIELPSFKACMLRQGGDPYQRFA